VTEEPAGADTVAFGLRARGRPAPEVTAELVFPA